MLGKFNFLCSFHIWVSLLKIYGFNDYNKFWFLACEQLTCLCIRYPAFVVFRKIILGVIRKWTSEEALNFEFYLSDWHFRHIPFTAVLISNTASEGDETPLFYRVEKNLGRPRPLKMILRKSYIRTVMISVNLFSTYWVAFIWPKYCR